MAPLSFPYRSLPGLYMDLTPHTRRTHPIALVLVAIASVQFGASLAKTLFGDTSPVTLAFWRAGLAALILLPLVRPRVTRRSLMDWSIVLGYGLCLSGMNLFIYMSFARIPIGVAVTLEFIGPLLVAVLASRRSLDLLWVALAGTGVVLLGAVPAGLDPGGVAFALLAGAMWGLYILLSGPVGRRWEGASGLCLGSVVGAIALAAPGVIATSEIFPGAQSWAVTAAVALLSTVIPYGLELHARRSISAGVFGILMSLDPAVAALFGWTVLDEWLGWQEWLAIVCVIIASVGTIWSHRHRQAESPR